MYLVNTPALQDRSSKPKGISHDLKIASEAHGLNRSKLLQASYPLVN